ncbi:MAG: type 1 glutamine amidotransferase [Polyangia bacterium]
MDERVLILDGSIWPEIYRPTAEWRALLGEVPSDSVRISAGESVPDPSRYSHLIFTGSEASITKPEPWFEAGAEAIRRGAELGMPILGSCFGHQLLVRTLSGERCVAPCAEPELGWLQVEITARDELLDGLPDPFWVFVAHFDEVPDPPRPWRVLARSDGCAVQAMRLGDRPIWGIQAHPEITPEDGRVLLEGFCRKAPDKAELVRPALEMQSRDDGVAAEIARRFLAAGPARGSGV